MKTYNEMAENVFNRIGEYETAQKRKRKIIKRTAVCMCCACLVAVIGVGSHNAINAKQDVVYQEQIIRSYGASPDPVSLPENGQSDDGGKLIKEIHEYGEGILYQAEINLNESDRAEFDKKYEKLCEEIGKDRVTLTQYKDSDNVEHLKLTCVAPEGYAVDLPVAGGYGYYVAYATE